MFSNPNTLVPPRAVDRPWKDLKIHKTAARSGEIMDQTPRGSGKKKGNL